MNRKMAGHTENLLTEQNGPASLEQFAISYPELDVRLYAPDQAMVKQLADELLHTDIVIVHEWCEPQVVAAILELRDALGFKALFLDTHHRASSSPQEIERLHVRKFDGILAFGEALRSIYHERLGMSRAWTLHEAADISRLTLSIVRKQLTASGSATGAMSETRELHEYLIEPARALHLPNFEVYGVRYPEQGQRDLTSAGIAYKGYLPNLSAACVSMLAPCSRSTSLASSTRRRSQESLPSGFLKPLLAAFHWCAPRGKTRRNYLIHVHS